MDITLFPTRAPKELQKEPTKELTQALTQRLSSLQNVMYAQQKYSLLIILQGMDASGKDGVVKKVFSGVNPMGCMVKPFKAPTPEELSHDFLWRVHKHTPPKGMIHIFNRSHYEDVLVPRVENWVSPEVIKRRFQYINSFEQLLTDSGTIILKFFLHVSAQEQQERLQERLCNPEKLWKYDPSDKINAAKRDQYLDAYAAVFTHCNQIPWHIVPSDQNWYKEYFVAKTIVEALEALDLQYPKKEEGS